jgi:hypothetical protein
MLMAEEHPALVGLNETSTIIIITTIIITTTSLMRMRQCHQLQLQSMGDKRVYHKPARASRFTTTITLEQTHITIITTTLLGLPISLRNKSQRS